MSAQSEKVYVIGGTGDIGRKVVSDLLKNGISVTVYARSPAKVTEQHPNASSSSALLNVVQGDYDDLAPFTRSIAGHIRLLLVVVDYSRMVELKTTMAQAAYRAGVKQIVDISSQSVSLGWRSTYIGATHAACEKAILKSANKGQSFVALRPAKFMTNHIWQDLDTIRHCDFFSGATGADVKQGFVSTTDIAWLAAKILMEPVEKHGDAVYEMVSYALSSAERAAIFSKVLGRTISYKQRGVQEQYQALLNIGLPHRMAYDLVHLSKLMETVTDGLPALLGRDPETFEEWLINNKGIFL